MRTWQSDVGLTLRPGDRAELLVVDLSGARALFAGMPAARLLARMRLASDEADLGAAARRKGEGSSWDVTLARLFAGSAPALERVKRAVARQTRSASEDGPLRATEASVSALAFTLAASAEPDASAAEVFASEWRGSFGEPALARACAALDPRFASAASDRRAVVFEACVRLAARAWAGPWPLEKMIEAVTQLAGSELQLTLLRRSSAALFPLALDAEIPDVDRRMALLERAELDAMVTKDPRELASAIARSERDLPVAAHLDTLLADLGALLGARGELVLAVAPPDLSSDEERAPVASLRPSWVPTDWTSHDAASALADAVERGTTTVPRLEGLVSRGGEPALDAIGAEMLRVAAHPFASAVFAELLARSGRPRDVIRLVTYFAVAPDPAGAAHALNACTAAELPTVLRAWLEAMLPSDGAPAPFGDNPDTSSAARLTDCVRALAPYPRLYGAVRPLLSRVSEAPPPHGSDGPDVS